MDTDRLNRWLTLGANIGVLTGLVLLIVEIDQNSDLVRAQIHQSRSDNYESFMVSIADSEFLLPAYQKFLAAGGPVDVAALDVLDETERERIRRYYQGRLNGYDNLYLQYTQGYLDEEFYESKVVVSIRRLYPVLNELGLLEGGATPSFRAEIERLQTSE